MDSVIIKCALTTTAVVNKSIPFYGVKKNVNAIKSFMAGEKHSIMNVSRKQFQSGKTPKLLGGWRGGGEA